MLFSYLWRVDTLVEGTGVQCGCGGPGLVPVALHGAGVVGHTSHRILEPHTQATGVAAPGKPLVFYYKFNDEIQKKMQPWC